MVGGRFFFGRLCRVGRFRSLRFRVVFVGLNIVDSGCLGLSFLGFGVYSFRLIVFCLFFFRVSLEFVLFWF